MLDKISQRRLIRSIPHYKTHAIVQAHMAQKIVQLTKHFIGQSFKHIFEIGCGCGVLTSLVVKEINFDALVAVDKLDAFRSYIECLDKRVSYIKTDVADDFILHFRPQLVISNAVFHWISDLDNLLKRLSCLIDSGGCLVFSTFSKGNLKEISKYSQLHYYTVDEIKGLVLRYFKLIHINEETLILNFSEVQDLLRHFRYTGVNCMSHLHWTRKDLQNFTQQLKGQTTLTFSPVHIVAQVL